MEPIRVTAPAKINLHLAVGPVRADGYHPVETVLQSLEFGDTVTIAPADALTLWCTPDLGLPERENLAYRAAEAMGVRYERAVPYAIDIEKRIPAGAGLGGGSADAAAVIYGLATLWGLDPAGAEQSAVARALGADVPFFLSGGAALYTGRGDVLVRQMVPLDAPVVLVRPKAPVPTAAAYAAFDALPPAPPASSLALEDALAACDVAGVAAALHNGMTAASRTIVPAIGDALDLVRRSRGILGALMAGSGSAVFGICESIEAGESVAARAREAGYWAVATPASAQGCVSASV